MVGARGTNRREQKCIHNFGGGTCRKETIGMTSEKARIRQIGLRTGTSGDSCEHGNEIFGSKNSANFLISRGPNGPREGLCSMKIVAQVLFVRQSYKWTHTHRDRQLVDYLTYGAALTVTLLIF